MLSSGLPDRVNPTEPEDHGNEEHQADPEDRLCSPGEDAQPPEQHQQPTNTQVSVRHHDKNDKTKV